MTETGICSLGQEDTLEEGMASHCSILAWKWAGKSHLQRSLSGYSPWGCKELNMAELLSRNTIYIHTYYTYIFAFRIVFPKLGMHPKYLEHLSETEKCSTTSRVLKSVDLL